METILLVVHLVLAAALILVVLLQKTAQDGGGLMGGGNMGGLFTARGSANVLTRTTAILAAGFFCTSLALAFLAARAHQQQKPLDAIELPAVPAETAPDKPAEPAVPLSQ